MSRKTRSIEIDSATADALESRARELGKSVSELLAELVAANETWPSDLEQMRKAGRGPWSPSVLAEDARRYEALERTGEGVPWEEVRAWIDSWGTPAERPRPKPRKL